jgi:1-propanol dehydrogenase
VQFFHCNTKLIFGSGAVQWLAQYKASSVLVVTDRYFEENGTAARIGALVPGAAVTIFSQVTPDPPAEVVAKGVAVCRQCQPDLMIALGGGSPMDCAKAMGYLLDRRPTFVAIPTTSGTGSEVTSFSIVTHSGKKHPIVDETLRPDYAILDPDLLTNLPKGLIADAGMDILSHDLEAVAAKGATPLTDALARESFGRCMKFLPTSFSGDLSAREPVHLAATMAGMAFDQAGLGICHALAHALGGQFHVPHGRLNGILLPAVLEFNAPACLTAYADLARSAGIGGATERLLLRGLTAAIVRLRSTLAMPGTLHEAGISTADLDAAADALADAALADACAASNPRPATREDLKSILRQVR